MNLWGKGKQNGAAGTGGDAFEDAAARVTVAEQVDGVREQVGAVADGAADRLEIRPEWANAAARLCFLPAARLSHPAYALTDDEAETITPQIQALLQAVADKYAPALVGRVANRHPELFDAAAALGVLYWQKWRYVSKLRALEAEEAARAKAEGREASAVPGVPPVPTSIDLPLQPRAGERDSDGIRVI